MSPNEPPTEQSTSRTIPDAINTIDDALSVVRWMRSGTMEDREGAIQHLEANHTDSGWPAILRELLVQPTFKEAGASVVELLGHLDGLAHSRNEAKQIVARLLDGAGQWTTWTKWFDVPDRDELRLRLEVLARCESWTEELVDFVTFFFRASVSDLYQEAAIALGRHLHHSTGLRSYLSKYAASRSVPLDRPIHLNGQRMMRRLLIALSAARGTEVPQLKLADEPLPILRDHNEDGVIQLPESQADLFALLLAAELALIYERDASSLLPVLDRLIERVAHHNPATVSRTVVNTFGKLLVRRGSPEAMDHWWRTMFEGQRDLLRRSKQIGFSRRVSALRRVDELLHTMILMSPEASVERNVRWLLEDGRDDEQWLILLRLLTWAMREYRTLPKWGDSLLLEVSEKFRHENSDTHVDTTVVLAWHQLAIRRTSLSHSSSMVSAPEATSRSLQLLNRLLTTMPTQHAWLSHDEHTRALITMLIVDQTQHIQAPLDQIAMVMAHHGVRVRSVDMGQKSFGARRGTPNAVTTSIYLRLLAWEKSGAEDLIDPSTLHRIDDERVLLALTPPTRRSPLLSMLADAFEHQLRWHLRGEAGFSADAYLALISVRRPHQALYRAMQTVCTDRTYTDAAGTVVPVGDLIAAYADDEERAVHAGADTDARPGESYGSPALVAPIDQIFARSIRRLRARMTSLADPATDVRIRLTNLAELLGETPGGQPPRYGTFLAVLTELNEPDEPLIRAGYPTWSDYTLDSIETALRDAMDRLRAAVHELLPEDWESGDEAREAVNDARGAVHAMRTEVAVALPAAEATLLRQALDILDEELRNWSDSIDRILEHWPKQRLHPDEVDFEACDQVLSDIQQLQHPILKSYLLDLLWRSLRTWVKEDGPEDPWAHELTLLDWGVTKFDDDDTQSDALHHATIMSWRDLLDSAMGRQEERRVRTLVESDRYASLRHQSESAELLERAYRWCLDRYLLSTARLARTDVRASRGRVPPTRWTTIGSFIGNFSTMWVALLMGAIFMLDFGDAWAAMADPDIGDIRGITLSFLIAIVAAFIYIYFNLRQKSRPSPGESPVVLRRSQLVRAGSFTGACLAFSALIVTVLWWLLSRTDEVVLGIWAIGHIIVWSGFAIFIGVFLGLLAGHAMRGSS